MIRPSSAYSNSTRRARRMINLHPIVEEDTCAMQITTLPRSFLRNNPNEGQQGTQQMQETAPARAENSAMRAGMHSPAKRDLRVCMHATRHWRGPHEGIPWVEVIPKEYCRNSTMHSTL